MDDEFLKEPFFQVITGVVRASCAGEAGDGIRRYTLEREDGGMDDLYLAEMLSREEKELWEAVKQLFSFAVKTAEAALTGTYDLELIYAGDRGKLRSFQPANLAQLFVNHGKAMQNGETRLIRYAASRFILKKLVPGDWGKIRFRYGIVLFGPERDKLDLLVKKMISSAAAGRKSVIVLRDLSAAPVFRFGEEPQTERLGKLLEKAARDAQVEAVIYSREEGQVDLLRQFGVRD